MAIVLIKEASKAVGDISSSLFFPIVPGLIDLIMLVVWGVVLIHLFSSGQPICRYNDRTPPNHLDPSGNLVKNGSDCSCSSNTTDVDPYCQFWAYSLNKILSRSTMKNVIIGLIMEKLAIAGFVFCVFAVLWFGFFISGFNQMVLGGAFGHWYWAFRKPRDLPRNAVLVSLSNTVKYHLGSIAFGSFLIATIRFIRYLLDMAEDSARKNFVVLMIVAIVKCICSCIEELLRYLNKNAYIIVIGIAYGFGKTSLMQNLNYGWLPLVCIFIGSVIICNIFFEVFDMAVDTIFLCFVEDLDSNDGTPAQPHYMSNELKNLLLKDSSQSI
uniref:Choline transporter-like protein n=1 Tax=Romanomermis culicivorax TaxID=13658 RepID=A0A915IAG5_ROMCU